ncbi:unnamed protein product [Leuciscus chuanchicus]
MKAGKPKQARCGVSDKSPLVLRPSLSWHRPKLGPGPLRPPASREPCLAKPVSTHQSKRKRRIDDLMCSLMDLSSQSDSISLARPQNHTAHVRESRIDSSRTVVEERSPDVTKCNMAKLNVLLIISEAVFTPQPQHLLLDVTRQTIPHSFNNPNIQREMRPKKTCKEPKVNNRHDLRLLSDPGGEKCTYFCYMCTCSVS